jgi:hypothetical protein
MVASPNLDRRLARWGQLGQTEVYNPGNCSLEERSLAHPADSDRK